MGILSTEKLSVGYEKNKAVIGSIDIDALKGQVISIIGPNGAGKSTILRTLSGLLAPIEGTVRISGTDIRLMSGGQKAKQMAVVLTEKLSVSMTTAYEIAAMGRIPYTGFFGKLSSSDHEIIQSSLREVGAQDLSDRMFASLSDGEKQKIMIARALAQQPQLIILDEPTNHLDIKNKIELVRILGRLAGDSGLTVILALHEIDIAAKASHVMLMVKDGCVVAQGNPEDIVDRNSISRLYDIEGASYDAVLGSMELCNDKAPEIFVASGAGTGVPVYRMLSKMNYGIATGILHRNDIDYSVASAMKLNIVSEESFCTIGADRIIQAEQLMKQSSVVVDTGFPVGDSNKANIELIRKASQQGIACFSMRESSEIDRIYKSENAAAGVRSVSELQSHLKILSEKQKNNI